MIPFPLFNHLLCYLDTSIAVTIKMNMLKVTLVTNTCNRFFKY